MKRISLVSILSLILVLLGVSVMGAWVFHIPELINLSQNYVNMMFNTALCFFIAGMTIFMEDTSPRANRWTYTMGGMGLLAIAGVTLAEYLFDLSTNIDQAFVAAWADQHAKLPGRMSVNSALAFIFTGITFIFFASPVNQYRTWSMQVLIILIAAIGVSALLGYFLDIKFLYSWYGFSRMAIHAAIGFSLLGVTLWLAWRKNQAFQDFYAKRQDKKILLISMLILFSIAGLSSLLGFVISAKQDETAMQQYLQASLKDRAVLLRKSIEHSANELNELKQNSEFRFIVFEDTGEHSKKNITNLLLDTSFSAIKIKDKNGKTIYSEGNFLSEPQETMPLSSNHKIVWNGRFYLEMETEIKSDSMTRTVILQWPVNIINELIENSNETIGRGYYLCFKDESSSVICLPPGYKKQDHIGSLSFKEKKILSDYISKGYPAISESITEDARRYLIAYSPVDTGMMGLVQKTDLAVMYKPVTYRLLLVVFVMLVAVTLGTALLYWMVAPLVVNLIKTKNKLQESEERFRLAFDSSVVGMALIGVSGRWLQVNPSLCQILGYSKIDLLERNFQSLVEPNDIDKVNKKLSELTSSSEESTKIECRYIHHDGKIIWILLSLGVIHNEDGHPQHLIASYQDITKEKEVEEKLYYQAHHDALTGLANRTELKDRLAGIITTFKRNNAKFAVFYIDLDRFKQINDSLGHDAGDRLLKVVAERLLSYTRKCDVVCRLGGDEFVLVLTDLQEYKAAAVFAERVINMILKPIHIKGHELFVTASIGISFYPGDGDDAETLIKNADTALYQAKEKGRNNYQFCEPEVSAKIHEKMSFEQDIRKALERGEFQIYYLPQINVVNNTISAVEGLLRWQSKVHGLVSPNQILPIAEETGLIIPLSEWIILAASKKIRAIQDSHQHDLALSVNVSARHFMHQSVIESVVDVLQSTAFDPNFFRLEINENLIMQDPNKTIEITSILKKYGIKIVIDNFGTGYSSLSYLQDFSVDAIKIDRSILGHLNNNPKRADLVYAMISLAKNLGIRVIAEGVETKAQYDFLISSGCDEIQGYYISQPIEPEKLAAFIEKYRKEPIT